MPRSVLTKIEDPDILFSYTRLPYDQKLRYRTDENFRFKHRERCNKRYHENKNSVLWPSMQKRKRNYYQSNREKLLTRANENYRNKKIKELERIFQNHRDTADGFIKLKVERHRPKKAKKKVLFRYLGQRKTLGEWCRELDLNYVVMKGRIYHQGLKPEEAFTKSHRYEKAKKKDPQRTFGAKKIKRAS